MRNIKARFLKEELKTPFLGACVNMAKAVRGQKFSRKSIVKAVQELIPSSECKQSDIFQLVNFLEEVSNTPEEGEIEAKNALRAIKN